MAPSPSSAAGGGGGRGDLLDAIRSGATLRKAVPAPAAPPTGRSALLSDIQNRGFQLRKAEERKQEDTKRAPPAIAPTGAAASIAAVLARRSAITGDDSDSDGDDDEWD